MDKPLLLPISEIIQENPHVKTFMFDYPLHAEPGQFAMFWIPGVDQKPLSISYSDETRFGTSVFAVGPFSQKMFDLKVGDRVGVTGPYGTGFSIQENTHYIMIAGGYGAGPLALLAERLQGKNCTVDFCVGARTKDLLLFEQRMQKLPFVTIHTATNDGSLGHAGFVTEILEQQLRANLRSKSAVLCVTCGPELMEKKVLDICNAHEINCEISIERYMKCGYGVCGQCCVDGTGKTMCKKGPVVDRATANNIIEFGKYHRDKSGTIIEY